MSYEKIYFGSWASPHGADVIDVENPATEALIASVPRCDASDIDRAVASARNSLDRWSRTTRSQRQGFLRSMADVLRSHAPENAEIIASELGMPIDAALSVQALEPAVILDNYADEMDELIWEHTLANSLIVKEPVGVVGAITPWNYPLYQIACKVGAALAAGCTVVLKPSELTPLNAYALIAAAETAGLPSGVLNMVTGLGAEVGEALVSHPGVDAISFTGSTAAGRRVAHVASATVKRVSLELGGKSASLILEGASLPLAVAATVRNCFRNSGQSCSSHTRLLVPRCEQEEVIALATACAADVRLGNPMDHGDHLGPLVSSAQRDRVIGYIRAGIGSGARLLIGGEDPPVGHEHGYYVRPTVFADVDPSSTIAQEEIFGPVLCIIPYSSTDEAISIANSTPYGLAAGIWSGSDDEAMRVARLLRAGEVELNGAAFNVRAPFGGFGQSGYGRELGVYGIEEFLAPKAIRQNTDRALELVLAS
jgi:acyl-CoA reductase-like NAD-dependent aldehyde dehydrogenase